jgi:predicted aspartyl protease
MSVQFDPHDRLVVVAAKIWGPLGSVNIQLAVDTGATATIIRASRLELIGYDPTSATSFTRVAMGSGIERVPVIVLERIEALEQEHAAMSVLCHSLPPEVVVDGLLGLDFFRGLSLQIDFRDGWVNLD